jgi:hypothetical protein
MYRLYPKQVIKNFNILVHKFGYNQQFSESDLRELFTNKDTKSHNVKEIRNVGLLKKSSEFWIIPKIVQDVSEQNNLGEYVRKNLINNTLIQNILEESKVNENFLVSNLSDYLKNRFIFTKASDKTWVKYANILKKWMTEFYICEIINDKFISPNIDRSKIPKRLGNLDFLISKSSSNHK